MRWALRRRRRFEGGGMGAGVSDGVGGGDAGVEVVVENVDREGRVL